MTPAGDAARLLSHKPKGPGRPPPCTRTTEGQEAAVSMTSDSQQNLRMQTAAESAPFMRVSTMTSYRRGGGAAAQRTAGSGSLRVRSQSSQDTAAESMS